MTWTFSNDFTTSRDRIRSMIGDTDTTDQLVTDERIAYLVTVRTDEHLAAARACEDIAAKFARKVNTSTGGLSVSASARMEQYIRLASLLRTQRNEDGLMNCTILVGGATIDDIDTLDGDATLQQPGFKQGQFDNSGTDPSTDTDD